jgi:UDP-glucuronate 4-epimerase
MLLDSSWLMVAKWSMFIFARAILAGEPIKLFNHGNMRRDFTYIDDVSHSD